MVAHRRTRLLETPKTIFWKIQTKCNLRKHFLPSAAFWMQPVTTKWGQNGETSKKMQAVTAKWNGENSKKLKITYFRSIIFWFFTSSFLFPHNVVSTATHRRIRLLETRKIIFWKMQTKCDLRKHSFTLCSILNAGRYNKMGPKRRKLEKNAGRYHKMGPK